MIKIPSNKPFKRSILGGICETEDFSVRTPNGNKQDASNDGGFKKDETNDDKIDDPEQVRIMKSITAEFSRLNVQLHVGDNDDDAIETDVCRDLTEIFSLYHGGRTMEEFFDASSKKTDENKLVRYSVKPVLNSFEPITKTPESSRLKNIPVVSSALPTFQVPAKYF